MKEKVTSLIELKGDLNAFFSEIYKRLAEGDEDLSETLIILNNERKINIVSMGIQFVKEGGNVFQLRDILENVITDFNNISAVQIVDLMSIMHNKMENDLMAGSQFSLYKDIAETSESFTKEIIEELKKRDQPFIVGYIATLYGYLSNSQKIGSIHEEISHLFEHESIYIKCGSLRALAKLDYSSKKKLLKKSRQIYQAAKSIDVDEIRYSLICGYREMLKYDETICSEFIGFSSGNNAQVDYALSETLVALFDENNDKKWYKELFLSLCAVSCEHKGTLRKLDIVLYRYIKLNNVSEPIKFITSWACKSDFSLENVDFCSLFETFPSCLKAQKSLFQSFITRLINHDELAVVRVAVSLINYAEAHGVKDIELDKSIAKKFTDQDRLYVGRKILAYIINPQILCSLCFSLLAAAPRKKHAQSLVFTLFINHIGRDFTFTTINFLKDKIKSSGSQNVKRVLSDAVTVLEDKFNKKKDLQILNETIPPTALIRLASTENSKMMNKSMKDSKPKNSLLNFVTQIPLKFGTGWFNLHEEQYGQTTKLQGHSISIEMPSSEVCHPVDAAIERYNFRLAKRDEK